MPNIKNSIIDNKIQVQATHLHFRKNEVNKSADLQSIQTDWINKILNY